MYTEKFYFQSKFHFPINEFFRSMSAKHIALKVHSLFPYVMICYLLSFIIISFECLWVFFTTFSSSLENNSSVIYYIYKYVYSLLDVKLCKIELIIIGALFDL